MVWNKKKKDLWEGSVESHFRERCIIIGFEKVEMPRVNRSLWKFYCEKE